MSDGNLPSFFSSFLSVFLATKMLGDKKQRGRPKKDNDLKEANKFLFKN